MPLTNNLEPWSTSSDPQKVTSDSGIVIDRYVILFTLLTKA